MSKKRRERRGGIGIDITPLIDVLFMLIIFIVLTAAFLQGSIVVDLPAGDPPPIAQESPIVLAITRDLRLMWGGEEVTRDRIPALVTEAVAKSQDILVAGDREARYGDVAELLDELRRLGAKNVGIAFEAGE